MMMQKISATSSSSARTSVSRRSVVQVRADWVSEAFTRVFTPTKASPTVQVDYKGRAARKSNKPFRDGYVASSTGKARRATTAPAAAPAAEAEASSAEGGESGGPFAYLAGAIQRVLSNNFTNEQNSRGTGLSGLKGSIRQQRRSSSKGYHSTKY